MRKIHILGIVVIAVAIIVIISTAGDASTYVSFKEAKEMTLKGKLNAVHVVGKLPKDASNNIIGIEESKDKLSFSFLLEDQNNFQQKVIYNEPMPMDFIRSEQVVIIGSYKNDIFLAEKILMKCPSKYQDENAPIK